MASMNFPLRGARESAITTRYVGALVLPTRRKRMCTANLSNVLLETQRMGRARRSSVRGRTLFGLATALGLSQGPQVTDRGGIHHDHLAGPLELHVASGRELRGDGGQGLFDDDRVVLREDDARLFCHGPRLNPRHS